MKRHTRAIRLTRLAVAIIFWLGLWSFTAWRLGQPLLLPMPHRVAVCLWGLMKSPSFWSTTGASLLRVLTGLVLAVVLGFMVFRADSLSQAGAMLAAMFTGVGSSPAGAAIRSVYRRGETF